MEDVDKTILEEKWAKGKELSKRVQTKVGSRSSPKFINLSLLRHDRGFCNHMGMTIDFLIPALKVYHNTIDRWRLGRNADGFKDECYSSQDVLDYCLFRGTISEEECEKMMKDRARGEDPKEVLALPNLFQSLDFIYAILEGDVHANHPNRFTNTSTLFYGFVDLSGREFSSSFE